MFKKWLTKNEARSGTTNWSARQPVRDFRSMSTSKVTFGDIDEPMLSRGLAGITGSLGQMFTAIMYPGGVGLPSTPPNWPFERMEETDKYIDVAGELPIRARDDTKEEETPFKQKISDTLQLMEKQAVEYIVSQKLAHVVNLENVKRIYKDITSDNRSIRAAFRFTKIKKADRHQPNFRGSDFATGYEYGALGA